MFGLYQPSLSKPSSTPFVCKHICKQGFHSTAILFQFTKAGYLRQRAISQRTP